MKINLFKNSKINLLLIIFQIPFLLSNFHEKENKFRKIYSSIEVDKYLDFDNPFKNILNYTTSSMNNKSDVFKNNLDDSLNDVYTHLLLSKDDRELVFMNLRNTKVMENSMEEIFKNPFFLNYTNITEINYNCRNILNIPTDEVINFLEVDFLLKKYTNQKKASNFSTWYRYSKISKTQNYNNLVKSYIFLINTKIYYYNYLILSVEYSDLDIFHWDINLDDMMTDTEFFNSEYFNITDVLFTFNNFALTFNVRSNDYINIDKNLKNIVKTNYENEIFNRPGLTEIDKETIKRVLRLKGKYQEFVEEQKFNKVDNLENNLGMEMIVNDSEYAELINATEWKRVSEIARNFTNNFDLSQKVDWKQFDSVFNQYKTKYSEYEPVIKDEYYIKYKEISIFEKNYYIWKKNRIENPVKKKMVRTQITNVISDSLFTDIGKNLHSSLIPLSLSKKKSSKNKDQNNLICTKTCTDNCLKNYLNETDITKCQAITCECYKRSDYLIDEEKIWSNTFMIKFYLKEIFIIICIFLVIFLYSVFAETLNKNTENTRELDHYQRIEDCENRNITKSTTHEIYKIE